FCRWTFEYVRLNSSMESQLAGCTPQSAIASCGAEQVRSENSAAERNFGGGLQQHHIPMRVRRAQREDLRGESGDVARVQVHCTNYQPVHEISRRVVVHQLRARSFCSQLRAKVNPEFVGWLARTRKLVDA